MIETSSEIRVRYAETDQMGVVYHSNYFVWFEVSRVEMLDKLDCPYKSLETDGYMLPVLECTAKFMRPARYDDRITIIARIEDKPLLRMTITYEVKRGEELLATGKTVHAFVTKDGMPVKPPARFVSVLKEHF